jgi:hypothetical protein
MLQRTRSDGGAFKLCGATESRFLKHNFLADRTAARAQLDWLNQSSFLMIQYITAGEAVEAAVAAAPTIAANNNRQNQRWDPFADMDRMQKDIDSAIHRATQQLDSARLAFPIGMVVALAFLRRSM